MTTGIIKELITIKYISKIISNQVLMWAKKVKT